MKNVKITTRPAGNLAGDRVARAIHKAVDAAPISEAAKKRVKRCGGCRKRRGFLNRTHAKAQQIIDSFREKFRARILARKPPET